MKKIIIASLIIGAVVLFLTAFDDDPDWNSCIKKYKSEWGEPCTGCTYNNDIFKVWFQNVCEEKIDVLISVQEKDKSWNCFYYNELAPNDTVEAHACKGSGKYLYWVKKAGDHEVEFPKCVEINEQYKD